MITLSDRIALFADGLQAAQGELVQCSSWDDVWEHAVALSDETPVVSPAGYEQLHRGELPDDTDP
ncbi:MAG: hypothetical protein F4188_06665 [Chloroflexi bacterium]|nr:hypothetical protein [Chloroflexota bacterium]